MGNGITRKTLETIYSGSYKKLVKKQGIFKTQLDLFKAVRVDSERGRDESNLKCVGQDYNGNTYYEDTSVNSINNRRRVKFNTDIHYRMINGDNVPPAWQGWLCRTYDDIPSDGKNFV